jgi:hypothetical protein
VGWSWRYEAVDGGPVPDDGGLPSPAFPSQADAESWIGETWQQLLEGGVEQVTLLEDGAAVYGPMGLRPPE